MMAEHVLKIWTEYFEAVSSGAKTVELRNDDRGYAVGDTLVLREWQPSTEDIMDTMQGKSIGGTTGRECRVLVTHITRGETWLQPGVVALSIRLIAEREDVRRIDDLGRVVIPKWIREESGIREGDPLSISPHGESVIIRRRKEAETDD